MGLRKSLFETIGFVNHEFSVTTTFKNKEDGFAWHLVIVYGSAYPEFKVDFVAELHNIVESASYPIDMWRLQPS